MESGAHAYDAAPKLRAAPYDPLRGRFLQTDPVGYEDDLNLYAYVRNDPLNRSDPSGKQSCPANSSCPTQRVVSDAVAGQSRAQRAPVAIGSTPSRNAPVQTSPGPGSSAMQAAGTARGAQTAVTTAAMAGAGSDAASIRGAARVLGFAGAGIEVVSEGMRAQEEINQGGSEERAVGGALGRLAASAGSSGTGALIGAELGTMVGGPPGGAVGGVVGGVAGAMGADVSGFKEAVGGAVADYVEYENARTREFVRTGIPPR